MPLPSPSLADLFRAPQAATEYLIRGWVRSKRLSSQVFFLVISDGSTQDTLQAVGEPSNYEESFLQSLTVGASVALTGTLVATPEAAQAYELQIKSIECLGEADPNQYPLQPKAHSYAFLRTVAHLRPRTATFGAVFRIRHALSYAIHRFFHKRGFFYVHTPIITAIDAEGAGDMFGLSARDDPEAASFFGRSAQLTVSGQLEAELLAMGLSKVYTFGPTFRAEHSNTTRHLAEFWMVEPEAAFYTLSDCIGLAVDLLQESLKEVIDQCPNELDFLDQQYAKHQLQKPLSERGPRLMDQIQQLATQSVAQISYTEAFSCLQRSKWQQKGKFEYPIREWGQDLQAEHERYLVKHYNGALIVRDYPAQSKAFYMRLNDDQRTVAAMDLLVPRVGELIGGSQREERLDHLEKRMKSLSISTDEMTWYLDTRRYGTVPHSGFGLGFERLMQLLTGMENIRDVIPFPRSPGQIKF